MEPANFLLRLCFLILLWRIVFSLTLILFTILLLEGSLHADRLQLCQDLLRHLCLPTCLPPLLLSLSLLPFLPSSSPPSLPFLSLFFPSLPPPPSLPAFLSSPSFLPRRVVEPYLYSILTEVQRFIHPYRDAKDGQGAVLVQFIFSEGARESGNGGKMGKGMKPRVLGVMGRIQIGWCEGGRQGFNQEGRPSSEIKESLMLTAVGTWGEGSTRQHSGRRKTSLEDRNLRSEQSNHINVSVYIYMNLYVCMYTHTHTECVGVLFISPLK